MRSSKTSATYPSSRILLVDDNKMGLAARRSVLEEIGHTVITAANGLDALAALQSADSVDLIVTDWKMPKLDGIELIRRLRESGLVTPIIILSGFADSAGMSMDKTGADAVVQKSSNEIQVLLSTVKRLLTRKPARKPPSSAGNPPAAKAARNKAV